VRCKKVYGGGDVAPQILNLDTRWICVVSFTYWSFFIWTKYFALGLEEEAA